MSRFTDKMFHSAMTSSKGMVTGEPVEPVRYTWREVHEQARRIAGGLADAGIGLGDAIGVLAGAGVCRTVRVASGPVHGARVVPG